MNRKPALALLLGLLTATGIWLLKTSTPYGLGLIDDAISYIAAARALLAGQGFTRIWLASGLEPITHWPPAFSVSLALISFLLKIDPYRSARLLNMLVLGGSAALLALLGYKMMQSDASARSTHVRRGSLISGILLAVFFLSNSAILRLHAQALSEPLYIFVSLLAFLAFVSAVRSPLPASSASKRRGDSPPVKRGELEGGILLTGFLTALAYLTRYAALSLLATFIVAIFILRPTWRTRFVSFGYFLLGALPPILAWMLRNERSGGSATNRALEWHPVTVENAQRGLREFFSFLIPSPALYTRWIENYFLLASILILFTLLLLYWLFPRGLKYFLNPKTHPQPEIIPFITGLYIFSYMGSLLVSLLFFDAATPLNDRILSPVYVAVLLLLTYFINKGFEQGKIAGRTLTIAATLFLLATFTFGQINTVKTLQETPTGFASWRWKESTVMAAIRELPEATLIYTNQPPAVYFWTNRPATMLWGRDDMWEAVHSGEAVLAIFFPADDNTPEFQAYLAELTDGLALIEKSGLGNLYGK